MGKYLGNIWRGWLGVAFVLRAGDGERVTGNGFNRCAARGILL